MSIGFFLIKAIHNLVHRLADPVDLQDNIAIGKQLVAAGYEVKIRPHSHFDGVKNSELEINGVLADVKETKKAGTSSAVQGLIKNAAKQHNSIAVLNLTHKDLTVEAIAFGIKNALSNKEWNKTITAIIAIYNGNICEISRSICHDIGWIKEKLKTKG